MTGTSTKLENVRTQAYGGTGGNAFDGAPPADTTRISSITVHAGGQVNTIQVYWSDAAGKNLKSAYYGGSGQFPGRWYEFTLALDETIVEVNGMADASVRLLTFKTNKGNTFGPYGTAAGTAFRVAGNPVVGFFGRSGWTIDQLGFIILAPVPLRPPRASTALVFDGWKNYAGLDAPLPLGAQVTLKMWVRGVSGGGFLFYLANETRRPQFSAQLTNRYDIVCFDAAGDSSGNVDHIEKAHPDVDSTAWSHWAFVRNSNTGRMAIYQNGELFAEGMGSTRQMASCNRIIIGADCDCKFFHMGEIAEVRLWNTERSAAQIKGNMNRAALGGELGLVLSWSFDGYKDNQPIMDGSGAGRHGVFRGISMNVPAPNALRT